MATKSIGELFRLCNQARARGHRVRLEILDDGYTIRMLEKDKKVFRIPKGGDSKEAQNYLKQLLKA